MEIKGDKMENYSCPRCGDKSYPLDDLVCFDPKLINWFQEYRCRNCDMVFYVHKNREET